MVTTRQNGGAGGRASRSRTRKTARALRGRAHSRRLFDQVTPETPVVSRVPSSCVSRTHRVFSQSNCKKLDATLAGRGMRILFGAPSWPSLIPKGCCCSVASYVVKIRQAHCCVHQSNPCAWITYEVVFGSLHHPPKRGPRDAASTCLVAWSARRARPSSCVRNKRAWPALVECLHPH
jgi:hypothetical protein